MSVTPPTLSEALAAVDSWGPDQDFGLHRIARVLRAEVERLAEANGTQNNPRAIILDHKWLDPECVVGGCRTLILLASLTSEREARHKLEAALRSKDDAMDVLFDRLRAAGDDCSDIIP